LPVVTHVPPVALRVPDEHREQAFAHLLLGAPRGDFTGDFDEPCRSARTALAVNSAISSAPLASDTNRLSC
jgi:hypothetical protein